MGKALRSSLDVFLYIRRPRQSYVDRTLALKVLRVDLYEDPRHETGAQKQMVYLNIVSY